MYARKRKVLLLDAGPRQRTVFTSFWLFSNGTDIVICVDNPAFWHMYHMYNSAGG